MATIVTVHGTFAHIDATGQGSSETSQWWQKGSEFERHAQELISGQDGEVKFLPFVWSAENSELERRAAGSRLLEMLRELDAKGESYCVIGHSHGGSVISAALVESVAYGAPLAGLKRWITVGTPFIEMKREPFLFTRLNLVQRVLFVASLMLLIMFGFYAGAELLEGAQDGVYLRRPERFFFSGVMMSLPFIFFLGILRYLDHRKLYLYKAKWIQRAKAEYNPKWLPLCHENDEAVQGLKYLPKVQLDLIDRHFAASTVSMAAILFLPLGYLFAVTSPTLMVGIANFLKNDVYAVEQYDKAKSAEAEEMERLSGRLRQARQMAEGTVLDPVAAESARQEAQKIRTTLRGMRAHLNETDPEFLRYERAQRFKRRFLEENGKTCAGGTLCGEGKHFSVNAKLMFHVVTDELSAAVISDEGDFGNFGGLLRLLIPIVLVPVISALVAIVLLMITEFIAHRLSAISAYWLNRLTLAEIKRSAFGNDTESEIAIGADRRPNWVVPQNSYLPTELGDLIASYSTSTAVETLAKFRKAITTLAFAEGETKAGVLFTYFTWKELIHATYFDVPEFRKLVMLALSRTEGFQPKAKFVTDPDYVRTGGWLKALEPAAAGTASG
ncbi:MAG: hypothetical protein WC807_00615 [Hyphomicrobium sp.]|jgi:hypothetical protein